MNSIIDNNGKLIVIVDNKPYTVLPSDHCYKDALEALNNNDEETFVSVVDKPKVLNSWGVGKIVVSGGILTYDGQEIHGTIVDRIFQLIDEDRDASPMINFLNNLMENPSKRSVDTLYDFMKSEGVPLTDDGCFLAYKFVRDDYMDCYTGKFDNNIGSIVSMPRNRVDDDPERTCSYGLHVGNFEYSGSPNGSKRVVIVKVNPKDVVCVPKDYDGGKMRVCKYQVVGEVERGTKMNNTVADKDCDYADDIEYWDNYTIGCDNGEYCC